MGIFAVIDTETNWNNQVMSLGIILANSENYQMIDGRYYIFTNEAEIGGMYDGVLDIAPLKITKNIPRTRTMQEVCAWLSQQGVEKIFAYNARFDCRHLPELSGFSWYDIMRLAAYRQYNPFIPADAICCSTGRLKCNYGVEPILRLLSGRQGYRETHNAYYDAVDELKIMELLKISLCDYDLAKI